MIVLLNDHELLGRLLVEEAITRRKQTNQNENHLKIMNIYFEKNI